MMGVQKDNKDRVSLDRNLEEVQSFHLSSAAGRELHLSLALNSVLNLVVEEVEDMVKVLLKEVHYQAPSMRTI